MSEDKRVSQIVLRTQRLLLRTEAEGDQVIWREHMNSPQVMAHIGGPRTEEQIARTFQRMDVWMDALLADYWDRDAPPFLLLERRDDGMLIGHCGLSLIETEEAPPQLQLQTQIGWTLRADCWGQGYAREAAEAVMAMAFEQLGLTTLFAQTSRSNGPSWRLMERLGMTRRADLDYVDPAYPVEDNPTIIYALSHADWLGAGARIADLRRAVEPIGVPGHKLRSISALHTSEAV